MDNAINNIIDNAIKYGGNTICISLEATKTEIHLSILDTGNTISKEHQDKIFEKFYRIPKGNTHTIKGFGIGLYYAKKIITKHHGTLDLELKNKQTIFKIKLPND
jgi:two-component system phosphate regulon sensor histidine kinase PhoR